MDAAGRIVLVSNQLNVAGIVNVGQGGPGAGSFGYNTDSLVGTNFGTLTNGLGVLPGNVDRLFSVPGANDLELHLLSGGSFSQNLFVCLYAIDLSGAVRQYLSSTATFGGNLWTWGTGSNPVWNGSVLGVNRNVWFVFK